MNANKQPAWHSCNTLLGYYSRVAALRELLFQFLEAGGRDSPKQIISLGAGFDTTWFHLMVRPLGRRTSKLSCLHTCLKLTDRITSGSSLWMFWRVQLLSKLITGPVCMRPFFGTDNALCLCLGWRTGPYEIHWDRLQRGESQPQVEDSPSKVAPWQNQLSCGESKYTMIHRPIVFQGRRAKYHDRIQVQNYSEGRTHEPLV